MSFFKSPNCVADAHDLCVDGAALHCVCPCHRESNREREQENDRKDRELDRKLLKHIEDSGKTWDSVNKRVVA